MCGHGMMQSSPELTGFPRTGLGEARDSDAILAINGHSMTGESGLDSVAGLILLIYYYYCSSYYY